MRASLLLLLALAGLHAVQSQLVIEEAQRRIDISTFRSGHKTRLVIRNDGSAGEDVVVLCQAAGLLDKVAITEVALSGANLPWSAAPPPAGVPAGVGCRSYKLPEALAPGARATLEAEALFTHVLRPEPAKIRQSEPQRVVYQDSALLASPYRVEKQSTEVVTGTSAVPSFTDVPPSKKSGSSLQYGPYQDTQPFTLKPISVHYENFAAFAHVPELEREIEISHWGNVYFEERYHLRHAGAKITGEWSRYDLMTRPNDFARGAIAAVGATLPPTAHSLYYRDAIGNISSSEARFGRESVDVKLTPRFPLFGGWALQFLFGWSMPLQECVRKLPSGRLLFEAPIGPSVHNLVVDKLTVKVVLPEGARDVRLVSASGLGLAQDPAFETKYTYLDVVGRPVLVLRADNVVDEMNVPFKVEYSYSPMGLLQKLLLLVAAFGALFAAAIMLNRSGASLKASSSTPAVGKLHAS